MSLARANKQMTATLAEIQNILKDTQAKIKPLPPRSDTEGMVRLSGIMLKAVQFAAKENKKAKCRATVLILSPTASEKRSMKRQTGTPPQLVAEVDCEADVVRAYPRKSKTYYDTLAKYKQGGHKIEGVEDDREVVVKRNSLLDVEFEGQGPPVGSVIEFFYGLSMWAPDLTEKTKKGASVACFPNGKNPKVLLEREDAVLVSLMLRAGPSLCTQRMPTFDELCAQNGFDPNAERAKEVYSHESFVLPITGNPTRDRLAAHFALAEPGMAMAIAPLDTEDKSFSYAPGGTNDVTMRRTALRFEAKLSQWPSLDRMKPEYIQNYQLTGGVYDLARTFYVGNTKAWKDLWKQFAGVEGFLSFSVLLGQTGQTNAEDPNVNEAYAIAPDSLVVDVPTVLLRDGLPVSHRFVQHAFASHKLMSADAAPGGPVPQSKTVINLTEMEHGKRTAFLSSPASKHWAFRAFTAMEVSQRILALQVEIAKQCEFALDKDGNRQPLCEALLDADWDGDADGFHMRAYGNDVPKSDTSAYYSADHPFLANQVLSMTPRVSGRSHSFVYVFAVNVGVLARFDEDHYGQFATPSAEALALNEEFQLPSIYAMTDGPPTITQSGEKRALENGDSHEPDAKRSAAQNGATPTPVQSPHQQNGGAVGDDDEDEPNPFA